MIGPTGLLLAIAALLTVDAILIVVAVYMVLRIRTAPSGRVRPRLRRKRGE